MSPSHPIRCLATLLGTAALVVAGAAPAAAHVMVERVQPHEDGSSTITFLVDHDCDAGVTTSMRMTLPDGVSAQGPQGPPGWSGRVEGDEVMWVASRAEAGGERRFTIEARIVASVDQRLVFPTVQECDDGDSYTWDDTDPGGDEAAPSLVTTAEMLTKEVAAPDSSASDSSASDSSAGSGQDTALTTWLLVGLGALVVAGGAGIVLTRRGSGRS